ncbi:hypothetical protein D3C86_1864430 [compost metagenome]
MGDVAAIDGAIPEAAHHLLGRDIAPELGNVAFVAALVDRDRLAVFFAPQRREIGPRALDARMGDAGMVVVIKGEAIVHAEEVPKGIIVRRDVDEPIPIRHGLGWHQVIFIGHRPPDIGECRQPRHEIF